MPDPSDPDDGVRFELEEATPGGETRDRDPIEAGDPSLVNTAFVALGVALTVFLLATVI